MKAPKAPRIEDRLANRYRDLEEIWSFEVDRLPFTQIDTYCKQQLKDGDAQDGNPENQSAPKGAMGGAVHWISGVAFEVGSTSPAGVGAVEARVVEA